VQAAMADIRSAKKVPSHICQVCVMGARVFWFTRHPSIALAYARVCGCACPLHKSYCALQWLQARVAPCCMFQA
jgi:hypothetical protein